MNISVATKTKRLLTSLTVGVTLFLPITAAPASYAASQTGQGSRIVTLADSGKTLNLHGGESFLLKLGESFDWTIKIVNQSIVRRVPNVMVVRGAQGIYRAHNVGSTKLTAVGDPLCRKATPACAAPSRLFTLKIRVLLSPSISFAAKLAACGSIPNHSTQKFVATSRVFINLPKDIYPNKIHNLQFKSVTGNTKSIWISNAGAYGESFRASSGCWSYYYEFEGKGEMDLRVKSAIAGMPNYLVRFMIR